MTQVEIVNLTGNTMDNERRIQSRLNKRWADGWTLYAAAGIRDGIALFFEPSSLRLESAVRWTVAETPNA